MNGTAPKGRILGRRMARKVNREEMTKVAGPVAVNTWTLTDPPDRDRPGDFGSDL